MGILRKDNKGLVEVVDKLLEKGAVVRGDVMIRLADIDLIYVGLQLLVTSISKASDLKGGSNSKKNDNLTAEDKKYIDKLDRAIKKAEEAMPKLIECKEPQEIEKGLAKLVLSLVELIRRLMEKEAIRQVKREHLSKRERQKLGMALKALAKKMELLKATFQLSDDDLNLDLGPLGNLY
jgi:hypothetical protein